jgi:uncharacterized Tic20 family protein
MTEGETKDENVFAAIAHASIIILPIIAPFLIWIVFKDKSRYIRFQALQALIYQFAVTVILMVVGILTFILSFLIIGLFLIPVSIMLTLSALLYGLYAGYETFNKKEFKYVLIGDYVAEKT